MSLPPSSKIRIMLVDDHVVMRMGLAIATRNESDLEVVAEAEDGAEALVAYRAHRPDVVVLDLRMPNRNGFETITDLRAEFPDARVLVFSSYASGDEALRAFKAGAAGFVVKEMPLERLLEGIRKVHEGEQYLPPEISRRISGLVLTQLSARELEVLTLLARGLSNKEIGRELGVVESTVKVHVTSILSKLGASDRTQAILAAVKRGIVRVD